MKMNNLEEAQELKKRKTYYSENPKGLGNILLNELKLIFITEAKELKEKIEKGCGKKFIKTYYDEDHYSEDSFDNEETCEEDCFCEDCQEAIKILKEILK